MTVTDEFTVDPLEYEARQQAKVRARYARVVTDLRVGPWTDAEDAIAARTDIFMVEKMAILQRSQNDITNRMARIVFGVEAECQSCGALFMAPIKSGVPRRYCSVACRHESRRTLTPISCGHCQKVFKPHNSTVRFCSTDCVGKSRRMKPIACAYCQEMFTPPSGSVRFCSKPCRHASRRTVTPIPCGYCQKVFRPHTASVPVRFCSRWCTGKAKTAAHIADHSKPCSFCGTVFIALVTGPGGKRNTYCSQYCAHEAVALPKKVCPICQAEFRGKGSRRTCSRECGTAYRIAKLAANREQWRRDCPQCGESFIAKAISSHNGVLQRRKFCSKDCAVEAGRTRPRPIVACAYCSAEFGQYRPMHKFCSPKCGRDAAREKTNS